MGVFILETIWISRRTEGKIMGQIQGASTAAVSGHHPHNHNKVAPDNKVTDSTKTTIGAPPSAPPQITSPVAAALGRPSGSQRPPARRTEGVRKTSVSPVIGEAMVKVKVMVLKTTVKMECIVWLILAEVICQGLTGTVTFKSGALALGLIDRCFMAVFTLMSIISISIIGDLAT